MNLIARRFVESFASLALVTGTLHAETKLQGTGATFPAPVYQRWIADYKAAKPDVSIDYQGTGSGAGIKGITDKTVDFGASDAPLSKKELAAAGDIVQIPTVAGAVVLAYNLPDLKAPLKLDGPAIADIFMGTIKSWDDAKIAALNPGVTLPAIPVISAHRTDGSGTNYIFTNYLVTQSDSFESKVGAGKTVEWPSGQGGKGNEGISQIVTGSKGAIGYVELIYAVKNNIPFAQVKNKDGNFVTASSETVAAAGAGAVSKMDKSLAVNIWNQPGANSYPISAFTYVLVYKDLGYLKDEAKAKALTGFLSWATGEGEKIAVDLGYAPLAPAVQAKVAEAINNLSFNGQPLK